jgi:hypothetical protein
LRRLPAGATDRLALEDVMQYLQEQPACRGRPVAISMAQVGTELYWQLIENFIYTMVKFRMSDCAVMVCVTDQECMRLCAASGFPCYYYDHTLHSPNGTLPSALEQIAHLKLRHLPRALRRGVDLLMLDLDVGFLDDPMKLIRQFYTDRQLLKKDVIVQQDMVFIMDRSVEKWKTWYVYPMPNIGLFLARGTNKTADMFDVAWEDYQTMSPERRALPGKDQNKVVEAMKSTGTQWAYWPRKRAPLLDKVFKFENKTFELGGEAAVRWFGTTGTVAVHTTCYEQRTKMMGLKATNAFWNPHYYDPRQRTLTKALLWSAGGDDTLRQELRALVYLALVTRRALIVPNVLGPDGANAVDPFDNRSYWPGFRVLRKRPNNAKAPNRSGSGGNWLHDVAAAGHRPPSSAPADAGALSVLEPGFYWRVLRDYAEATPDPVVTSFARGDSLRAMERRLLADDLAALPRLVLDVEPGPSAKTDAAGRAARQARLRAWADDSVGRMRSYAEEVAEYAPLPPVDLRRDKGVANVRLAADVVQDYRSCNGIFETYTMRGNRSCFDRCR